MEALGIDNKLLIAQIINFALFFYIFKRFIAKPFFTFLESAEKKEKEKERILADLKKQEDRAEAHQKEILADAREEAAKITSDAKKTAVEQKETLIKHAQNEAADIKEKARKMIDEERAAITQKARDQVLTASTLLAKAALRDLVDDRTQEEIVKNIMSRSDVHKFYEN